MAGPNITYRTWDLITFNSYDYATNASMDPMPFFGVKFGEMLNATGSFTGSLQLNDNRVRATNWERSTRPNMSVVIVDVNGIPAWGGMITTRHYDRSTGVLEVSAMTFHQYFAQRLAAYDYSTVSPSYPHSSMQYWAGNPCDPTVIAAQVLWDALGNSFTMPTLAAALCNIGGGVQVEVANTSTGTPVVTSPAQIVGGWTSAVVSLGMNTGTSSTIYAFGNDSACAAGGGLAAPGSILPTGLTISSVSFTHAGSFSLNNAYVSKMPSGQAVARGVISRYALSVGMLAAGPGLPLPSTGPGPVTVTALGALTTIGGLYIYSSVTFSQNAATTVNGKYLTIGGYMAIVVNANVSKNKALTPISYSAVSGTPAAPTPVSYWIEGSYAKSQSQTVDSILKELSQMGYGLGFDYAWAVGYTSGDPDLPFINCTFSYPRKGNNYALAPSSCLVIDAKWVTTYEWTEDGTSQAVGVVESGAGTGGIAAVIGEGGIVTGNRYPPLETSASHTQISNATQLAAICAGDLALNTWPTTTVTITLPLSLTRPGSAPPNPGPVFYLSDFAIGDDVLFVVSPSSAGMPVDPRWPKGMNAGPASQVPLRIEQWDATIVEDGVSSIKLVCSTPPGASTPPPQQPLA